MMDSGEKHLNTPRNIKDFLNECVIDGAWQAAVQLSLVLRLRPPDEADELICGAYRPNQAATALAISGFGAWQPDLPGPQATDFTCTVDGHTTTHHLIAHTVALRRFHLGNAEYCVALLSDSPSPPATDDLHNRLDAMVRTAIQIKQDEDGRVINRALDAIGDAILITDTITIDLPGPRIVYVNPAFEAMSGYTAAEVLGKTPRVLACAGTSTEGRANIRAALQAWRPVRQLLLNQRKDGSQFWVELIITPIFDSTGWCTHWISVQRDMTTRQTEEQVRIAASQELEQLIALMPGALLRSRGVGHDGARMMTYVAPGFETLTGHPPQAAMQPDWLATHLEPHDLAELRRREQEALTLGEATTRLRFTHTDGTERVFLVRLHAERCNPRQEIISLWTDITKQMETDITIAHSAKMVQLGHLATGMAHELNQPLAMIGLAAENATRVLRSLEDPGGRIAEKLKLVLELTDRASSIVDHMRVFGRPSTRDNQVVHLQAVLDNVMKLISWRLKQEGVRFEQSIPADLPQLHTQQMLLEQVILNIIANSCDAHTQLGPRSEGDARFVRIAAEASPDLVRIIISDNAGGIRPEDLGRVFDPFFTTKSVGKGTGLGLSISYGIINDLGGTLSAGNIPGGARFQIELPLG